MSSGINSVRRYYLLKRFSARRVGDDALELVWLGKQEGVSGSPLLEDFPLFERLASVGYSTSEDLNGASATELRENGFSSAEAQTILTAFLAI
jgi:hypothetical protein